MIYGSSRSNYPCLPSWSTLVPGTLGFLFGFLVCSTLLLGMKLDIPVSNNAPHSPRLVPVIEHAGHQQQQQPSTLSPQKSVLEGTRILICIAAFDFSQLPHLEEVLDAYADLCAAGAHVHLVVHATMPYPVSWIDLLNSRFVCDHPRAKFQLTIALQSPALRLHLVDVHRTLMYDNIHDYDLFIYTEDDIRVTPRTVAAYMRETERVKAIVGAKEAAKYNVGIVRYEYNFPSNVIIDDKTRSATQNVTRVYWEHSYKLPAFPNTVDTVPQVPLSQKYVHMKNHHQGMFLATRDLLLAWKADPKCQFHIVKNRPSKAGSPGQPSEGTQRVWMSSQELYGGKHCNVQQVIPVDRFGLFTCLHLPNKNYRRVGNFRNRTFSDGTEHFETPPMLLTAMMLHIEMRERVPIIPQRPYQGIQMIDQIDRSEPWSVELDKKFSKEEYLSMVDKRMNEFDDYVGRGGVMSQEDMARTNLVELR